MIDPKELAKQLAKPEGEYGLMVAGMLHSSNEYICKKTYNFLNPQNSEKILEIGFADAEFLPHLFTLAENIIYTGIDVSQDMVNAAKLNCKEKESLTSAEFLLGSSSKMEFEDNTFDKVCSSNTIYFWENPSDDASEIFRVLKPGSKLVIALRPLESVKDAEFIKYGFTFYEEEELENLFSKVGFINFEFHNIIEPEKEFDGTPVSLQSMYMICEK